MIGKDEFNEYRARKSFLQRIWVAGFLTLFCFGLLFVRFAWLQIVHYEKYSLKSDSNRIKPVAIPPARGAIIDRNGVVLAYNASTYTIEVTPSQVKDMDALLDGVQALIPLSERDIRRFKQAAGNAGRRFSSVLLRSDLTQAQVAELSAQLYRFPGVEIKSRFVRRYPLKETASHVLGYISGMTEDDQAQLLENGGADNYRGTQEIGRVGVEAAYEKSLHGMMGIEEQETTAGGRPVRVLREFPPEPGHTIELSLDVRLQRLVEELYGDRRGAFVAIDPRNGEVLALVSKPTFNPNQFIEGFDQESWSALNDDALNRPLFHRAIGGTYPIGSTFKPFMALAGMQAGVRKPDEAINVQYMFSLGGTNWRSPGSGKMNVERAITTSNNYYFYTLAYEMGITKINTFMKPWGFGQLTGIDIPGEVRGTLPSPEWKRANFSRQEDRNWYDGETVNVGIGQGHIRFTILQLASATATLANRGQQYTPHLLLSDKNVVTGQRASFSTGAPKVMDVNAEYFEAVYRGMLGVTQQGTSKTAFTGAGYDSVGKTGTAQAASVPQGQRYDPQKLEEYKRDHSLYIAFAPLDNPQIAIALVVENAGKGGTSAAPIARRAMDYYLLGIYPSEEDIKALHNHYAGSPKGAPRTKDAYDIIPATEQVHLNALMINEMKPLDYKKELLLSDGESLNVQGGAL
ncbi:MAG: penicillin-binding protein 2 [Saezia sp.]